MAIFTSIIEKALRDTSRKTRISESAGLGEEEMDDISLQDMFQDESDVDTNLEDTSGDFYDLEAEEDFGGVNFDEEKAKEEKGDDWFTELKQPIEDYLKDSTNPVFLKGDVEIDKPALETALAELFKHLNVSPFSGNVIEDGSIKVVQREAGEDKNAEDSLMEVDGVAEELEDEGLSEAFDSEEDTNLSPMNDSAGDAEIVSLNVEWDGTSVGIGDMDVEYPEEEIEEVEEIEEEPEESEESSEDEEDAEESEEELLESLSAEEILNFQDMLDGMEDENSAMFEADLSDGGAKDEKVGDPNPSLKPSAYHFNNGGDDSEFVDGVEDLTSVDASTDAKEPGKSGEFFRGTFEGDEAPTAEEGETKVGKPKIDDFIPNTEEIISSLEAEGIKESLEFDNGGEQVDKGDDLEVSDDSTDVAENAPTEEFVWDSEFVDDSGNPDDIALAKFRDGDDTPLTNGKGDSIEEFISDEDELIEGAPEKQGE